MDAIDFGYSMKNIPLRWKESYKLIDKDCGKFLEIVETHETQCNVNTFEFFFQICMYVCMYIYIYR